VTTFLCVYFGSVCLAVCLTPLVIWLARHVGAVDRPGVRTVHERPIPRIGGVAIFFSAMALIVPVLFLNNTIGAAFREMSVPVTTMLGLATLVFLIGLVDDLKGLPARFKFLAELAAAGALCLVGVRINRIAVADGLILDLGAWGFLLTLLWVVGITNAVNLSDGLDGLAAGVSAIACGVIAIFAIYSDNVVLAVLMLALAGSLCGFLFFNFNPAKVFMGDCGSLFLGFTIAAASVICVAKSATLVGLTLPALALGIPIFDTLFSMLRRFLERRSLFAPDRGHFHHRLLDLGLRQRHAVVMIYLVTLLATGLGLFMLVSENISSLVVFACLLFLIVLLFRVVGAVRLGETLARLQEKSAYSRQERGERKAFEYLQLRLRQARDADQWWRAICEAAQRLELAWVSLQVTDAEGNTNVSVWRQNAPAESSRIITMTLPVEDTRHHRVVELEIAVLVNGCLESASHRAGLFSRLVDDDVSSHVATATGVPGPDRRPARDSATHMRTIKATDMMD
jgi:UDP-GlcNAc:undecaprenyl-phosphate GlcNAc-1-phosphate transferase